MERMENKKIWKKACFPLAVISLLGIILFGVQLTYGAYIRRSYIKAVIATNETEKLFGSNLLYGVKNQPDDPDSDTWLAVYPYTVADANQSTIKIPIKIYNYLAEDKDRVNQLDVSYIISIKVLGKEGTLSGYQINGYDIPNANKVYYLGTGGVTEKDSDAATQVLAGRLPNDNTYTINMPGEDLGKVSIAVRAKRVLNNGDSYGTDLLYLAARVVPSMAATVHAAAVEGSFLYEESKLPKDYAAFIYRIKLDGAPTVVSLSWNANIVQIDPFFEEKFGVKPDEGRVVFNMEPGISQVLFYQNGMIGEKTWEELGVTVSER